MSLENLKMAKQMLEQQGELNRMREERDEAQGRVAELGNELSDAQLNFADYRVGAEKARKELIRVKEELGEERKKLREIRAIAEKWQFLSELKRELNWVLDR